MLIVMQRTFILCTQILINNILQSRTESEIMLLHHSNGTEIMNSLFVEIPSSQRNSDPF